MTKKELIGALKKNGWMGKSNELFCMYFTDSSFEIKFLNDEEIEVDICYDDECSISQIHKLEDLEITAWDTYNFEEGLFDKIDGFFVRLDWQ